MMGWQVIHGDARTMPLDDRSVDLICTSPPYWGLRSYRDEGEHYDGQVGSESTPQQFVDELVGMIDGEWRRVLKPSGSLWLNLGDKYAGGGMSGGASGLKGGAAHGRPRGYTGPISADSRQPIDVAGHARPKSLLGIPWRVALALIDRGWILRAEVIWSKPNGLPESVTDRVRRSHEQWFHFTLEPRYYSAVDRIREPHATISNGLPWEERKALGEKRSNRTENLGETIHSDHLPLMNSPLGRLPGSVRTIPTDPLIIPDEVKERLGLVDHYAAFPQEWPRWIIEGWSPEKVCQVCGEAVRVVAERENRGTVRAHHHDPTVTHGEHASTLRNVQPTKIVGESCACDEIGPTTPGVILDPFGGTGTTAGVAHTLSRHGISVDLSADYCRLAEWRIAESGHFTKAEQRSWADRQGQLL